MRNKSFPRNWATPNKLLERLMDDCWKCVRSRQIQTQEILRVHEGWRNWCTNSRIQMHMPVDQKAVMSRCPGVSCYECGPRGTPVLIIYKCVLLVWKIKEMYYMNTEGETAETKPVWNVRQLGTAVSRKKLVLSRLETLVWNCGQPQQTCVQCAGHSIIFFI